MNINIHNDGKIDYAGEFLVNEAIIGNDDPLDYLKAILPTGDIISNFNEKEEIIDNTLYQGYTFSGDENNLNGLYTYQIDNQNATFTISTKVIDDKIAQLPIEFDILNDGNVDLSSFSEYGLEATLTIKMPGKITSASIGDIDNDTLKIDLTKDLGKNIVIKSLTDNKKSSILLIIAAIIYFGLIYFYEHKNHKVK